METKTIKNWIDLQQYGINMLTGEADPYCMRLLCDLNETGLRILSEFFGIPRVEGFKSCLPTSWNSGSIRSILLPRDIFHALAKFILYHVEKFPIVIQNGYGDITGGEWSEEEIERYSQYASVYRNPNPEPGKNRNVHQFTGRTY